MTLDHRRRGLGMALVIAAGGAARADTYHVAPCGDDAWSGAQPACIDAEGPKQTIQAAIDAASGGDVIQVFPGTYLEQIDLDGKAIELIGVGGAVATIIDGGLSGTVVLCNSLEGPDTVIEGFTITGGGNVIAGGGMLVGFSSPTVRHCRFEANFNVETGGAMSLVGSASLIEDCEFVDNEADRGAGMYIVGGTVTVSDCHFETNDAAVEGGAISCTLNADPDILECTFEQNAATAPVFSRGAGLYVNASTPTIEMCTFHLGVAFAGGGGVFAEDGSTLNITATTFDDNLSQLGGGGAVRNLDGTTILIASTFIDNGSSLDGGAVAIEGGSLDMTWCGFTGNSTNFSGGAVSVSSATTTMAGCTFTGNVADSGGGIDSRVGPLSMVDCVLTGNLAAEDQDGGGVWASDGPVDVERCTFDSNEAQQGGGIYLDLVADATIAESTFTGNLAFNGAGVRSDRSHLEVIACTFELNEVENVGSGVSSLDFDDPLAFLRVTSSLFTENNGSCIGAGSDAHIIGCQLTDNDGELGVGVFCGSGTNTRIDSCRFDGNGATFSSPAVNVAFLDAMLTMVNCVVTDNAAPFGTGAITNGGFGATLEVVNCAIVDNQCAGVSVEDGDTVVRNSIVRGNSFSDLIWAAPDVRYSNIPGVAGVGNIDADPLFVDPATGDFQISAGSPCIDAGLNWALPPDTYDVDDDGNTAEMTPLDALSAPRFQDDPATRDSGCGPTATVDIGPYEFAGRPFGDYMLGDVNGDGVVNVADLLAMLGSWGPCQATCCPADFDANGLIDVVDLLVLLGSWE